jgi:hypothetical protein
MFTSWTKIRPTNNNYTNFIRTFSNEIFRLEPMPGIHDLRHCRQSNGMRSGLHPLIADAIVGHGDRKKDVKSLCLTINDADSAPVIDRLTAPLYIFKCTFSPFGEISQNSETAGSLRIGRRVS